MKKDISMNNQTNIFFCLAFLIILSFFSCDEENINKEFGQYAVAVTYGGNELLELHFVIDGKECGMLVPESNVNPTYVKDCSALKAPDNLTNVFVLKEIPIGAHVIEIKNSNDILLKTLTFEMIDKECVFQKVNLASN